MGCTPFDRHALASVAGISKPRRRTRSLSEDRSCARHGNEAGRVGGEEEHPARSRYTAACPVLPSGTPALATSFGAPGEVGIFIQIGVSMTPEWTGRSDIVTSGRAPQCNRFREQPRASPLVDHIRKTLKPLRLGASSDRRRAQMRCAASSSRTPPGSRSRARTRRAASPFPPDAGPPVRGITLFETATLTSLGRTPSAEEGPTLARGTEGSNPAYSSGESTRSLGNGEGA